MFRSHRFAVITAALLLGSAVYASPIPRLLGDLVRGLTTDAIMQGSQPAGSGYIPCSTSTTRATWQTPAGCGVGTGGGGGGVPDSGWNSWACDFSSQSAVSISSNSSFSTCGLTFNGLLTFGGHTYADTMGVVPDAGLELSIHGTVGSSNGFAGGLNPCLSVDMTAIDPNWDTDTSTRLTLVWNTNLDAGFSQECYATIDNGLAGDGSFDWGFGVGIYAVGGPTVGYQIFSDINGTQAAPQTASNGSVKSAEQMTLHTGPWSARPVWRSQDAGWSSGSIPTAQTMSAIEVSRTVASNIDLSAEPNKWQLEICGFSFNGKSYACTLRAMSIEWRP